MLVSEDLKMSKAFDIKLYPQENKSVFVRDKFRVMNNEELNKEVAKQNQELGVSGRLLIRASGTEPKIRVMVESNDSTMNKNICTKIISLIEKINVET